MKKEMTYIENVYSWGLRWNMVVMVILLAFPLTVCILFGALPEWGGLLLGLLNTAPMYWAVGVIETFTYIPMLGAGGSYLSFVTGNISNLKLPCAINAMEGADVKANSEEGEVVSTIAIATSAIVTTAVLAIGILAFAPFLESFTENALLKPAFAQVLPALFGALGAGYFVKHWRISFFPIIVMIIVLIFAPTMGASTLLFFGIVASVLGALFMYKKGMLDKVKD